MENYNKALDFQPHTIAKCDLNNPDLAISSFFLEYPVHNVRQNLWKLFRAWCFTCGEYADEKEISSMLQFYENLELLMELTYIKNSRRTRKRLKHKVKIHS